MALLALVALFLPTATLASRNNARRCVHDIDGTDREISASFEQEKSATEVGQPTPVG